MEVIIEFLKEINIAQLFVIIASGWFFYNRLKNDMDKKFKEVTVDFGKVDGKFDKVESRFEKIENRLGKLEIELVEIKTILRMKECCMITDDRQMKKAE